MKTYSYPLSSGIRPTPEFAKKKLADYAVNVGMKCSHDCTYCSTGAMLRTHGAFKKLGKSSFASGYSIIDPDIPQKVALDAKRRQKRGIVQLCTVDAWASKNCDRVDRIFGTRTAMKATKNMRSANDSSSGITWFSIMERTTFAHRPSHSASFFSITIGSSLGPKSVA